VSNSYIGVPVSSAGNRHTGTPLLSSDKMQNSRNGTMGSRLWSVWWRWWK